MHTKCERKTFDFVKSHLALKVVKPLLKEGLDNFVLSEEQKKSITNTMLVVKWMKNHFNCFTRTRKLNSFIDLI